MSSKSVYKTKTDKRHRKSKTARRKKRGSGVHSLNSGSRVPDPFAEPEWALDAAEIVHWGVRRDELMALRDGTALEASAAGLMTDRSAAWLQSAGEELRRSEALVAPWLGMDDEELAALDLDGLDDLSLEALRSMACFRNNTGDLFLRASRQLLANGRGSLLLDYDWIMNDLMDYETMESDEEIMWLHRFSLQHFMHHVQDAPIDLAKRLGHYAESLFLISREEEAVDKLSCAVHVDPFSFGIWDRWIVTLTNCQEYRAASWALPFARARFSNAFPDEVEDFQFHISCLKRQLQQAEADQTPLARWEVRFRTLLDHVAFIKPEDMKAVLCAHLFPDIIDMPLKEFAA